MTLGRRRPDAAMDDAILDLETRALPHRPTVRKRRIGLYLLVSLPPHDTTVESLWDLHERCHENCSQVRFPR
jgi:hypothetical protein